MELHIAGPVLLWCHEGTAVVNSTQLIAGDLYYSPDAVHIYEHGLVIPLTFQHLGMSGPARRVHVGERWADVMVHEFARSMQGFEVPSAAVLRVFEQPAALPTAAQSPQAHAVSCAIAADPSDQTSLEEFAERCDISSRTLQRQFVNTTGFTFSEWRTAYRVHAAAELLSLGFSVAVAANMVGFAATSSLTRAFRRHTGCAPSKYALTGMGAMGEVPRIPGSQVSVDHDVLLWVYKGTATFTLGNFCRFMGEGESVTMLAGDGGQVEVAAQSIAIPVAWDGEIPDELGLGDVVKRCRLAQIVEPKVN